MDQSITLNVPVDLSPEEWETVAAVYRELPGWLPDAEWPSWYGEEDDPRCIVASAEPGGLLFTGSVETHLWIGWTTVLCAKLSLALGREIHDAEM